MKGYRKMARKNRITVPDGVYHVTARVAHGAMLLRDDAVKDRIFGWMRDIAHFSGVEIYAFCIMDNHLHLLVHVPRVPERYWLDSGEEPAAYAFGMRPPECRAPIWAPTGDTPPASEGDCPHVEPSARPPVGFLIPDDEMAARLSSLYGPTMARSMAAHWARMRSIGCSAAVEEEKSRYCRRMYNLSQFVKTLAERVAQRYNEEFGHRGCLWQGRFYSGVVENVGEVLAIVAAYIDYNPVKAGIATSPSAWRWSSFGLACSDRGEDSARARAMYERMLGCPWHEAKERMEAIFADRLPDDIDAKTLQSLYDGCEAKDGGVADDAGDDGASDGESDGNGSLAQENVSHGRRALRASQVIRTGLWVLRRGGYIGRSLKFGERVAGMLPAMFPRQGMKSLRLCAALSWELPRRAA